MTDRLYRIIEHCHVVFTGSNPTGEYCVHGDILLFHELQILHKYNFTIYWMVDF